MTVFKCYNLVTFVLKNYVTIILREQIMGSTQGVQLMDFAPMILCVGKLFGVKQLIPFEKAHP